MSYSRLLTILHSYDNRGGTEEHVRMLRDGLSQDFECYTLFPLPQGLVRIDHRNQRQLFPGVPVSWPVTEWEQPITTNSLKRILDELKPDLIHLHHLLDWPLGTLEQLIESGRPVIVSFHDYYFLTPHFTMQGAVRVEELFHKDYSLMLFQRDLSGLFRLRADRLAASLRRAAARIAPSQYAAKLHEEFLGETVSVIEHGIPAFEPLAKTPSSALRIGCLGSRIPQKGWRWLFDGFQSWFPRKRNVELHFYGGGEPAPQTDASGAIQFHSAYDRKSLPAILAEIDFAIIPSLFAETYCLVLSELWMGRVPVAATRIGALTERIRDGINGRLFTPFDSAELTELLNWIIVSPQIWKTWELPTPRSVEAMVADYRRLYRSLVK